MIKLAFINQPRLGALLYRMTEHTSLPSGAARFCCADCGLHLALQVSDLLFSLFVLMRSNVGGAG